MNTRFAELVGGAVDAVASAPGRVTLFGEHADDHGGFVLCAAVPHVTKVELSRRPGREVRVWNEGRAGLPEAPAEDSAVYQLGDEARSNTWLDHFMGITQALAARGHLIGGFAARVTSDVPRSSGLAWGATVEIALLRALRRAYNLTLDDVLLAMIAHEAEQQLIGSGLGVGELLATSLLTSGHALCLDTHSMSRELLPWPACELVIIDTAAVDEHALVLVDARRQECHQASQRLGVPSLRELDMIDLDRLAGLPEDLGRRARHVVTENARALAAAAALRGDDVAGLGLLLLASHASLRDDFEVTIPEIDILVRLAQDDPDVLGACMTGKGFGGAVVILADRGTGTQVGARLATAYEAASGRQGRVLVPPRGVATVRWPGGSGPMPRPLGT